MKKTRLWIVVNEYLRTPKFRELEDKYTSAAERLDIDLRIVTNSECMVCSDSTCLTTGIIPANNDPILFWDKDILLAKALEKTGHRLYNSSAAIETCDDKSLTALKLGRLGLRMPKTYVSPMTYSNIGYTNTRFLTTIVERISFPVVVKEIFGSFGMGVYLCNNIQELNRVIISKKGTRYIIQEYIKSSFGKDIRIQIVGGKAVAAMYRYSDNGDFRANITNGGHMKPYEPTSEEAELAINVACRLKLDFAGIDILFGEEGPVLCEINSNAHFKNIDDCTGSDVAYEIMKHILNNLPKII